MTEEIKTDSHQPLREIVRAELRATLQDILPEHEARILAAIGARENAALRWLKKFTHSVLSFAASIVKND